MPKTLNPESNALDPKATSQRRAGSLRRPASKALGGSGGCLGQGLGGRFIRRVWALGLRGLGFTKPYNP